MQPKMIDLPEIRVAGLGTKFISILSPDKNNANVIPPLWHELIQKEETIPHRAKGSWGLVEILPPRASSRKDELFYIAAVQVTSFDSTPPTFLQRTIAPGRYASFTHQGKLDKLGQTMNAIYNQWLPTSKAKLRPAAHLELYDERFDPNSDASEFDILLPV